MFDEAKKWYKESLEMSRRIQGQNADCANSATTVVNMGILSYNRDRLEDAVQSLELGLAILRRVLGDKHRTVIYLNDLLKDWETKLEQPQE